MKYPLILSALLCASGAHANRLLDIHNAAYSQSSTYLLPAAPPPSDPTANVLPSYNDAYANWVNAGLATVGGIPTISTQCGSTVSPSGITPPAGGDDASLIQAAVTACTGTAGAPKFVLLSTGTFNLDTSEQVVIGKSGVGIKGSGSAPVGTGNWGTVIQHYNGPWLKYPGQQCGVSIGSTTTCPNVNPMIFIGPNGGTFDYGWSGCSAPAGAINPQTNNCGTLFTADAAQGDLSITVASTAPYVVGQWVLIAESPSLVSTANPTGGANIQASSEFLTAEAAGTPAIMRMANPDGICTYSFCTDWLNQELHKVTAINSGTGVITFDDPITMAYRTSHNARVFRPTSQTVNTYIPFLSKNFIENLTITRCTSSCIQFRYAELGWLRNIEASVVISGAFNSIYSARIQVEGNYFHNCADCQNNGSEYTFGVDSGSTEVRVTNNIINFFGKGMVGRGSNTAVIDNNYVDDTFYETTPTQIGDYWLDMGVNGSHYAGTHHWLFEGNWGTNCDNDETHGSASYHTYFRNWCRGYRTPFTDPSISLGVDDLAGVGWTKSGSTTVSQTPGPLRAAGPMAFNYWDAYIGNVLGTSSTTSGAGWTYICTTVSSKCIWMSGWTGSEWSNQMDHNLNGATNTWVFRHADYDYVHGSVFDYASGTPCGTGVACSHTLPDSFFLASAPAFFSSGSGYTWPWVTPTGSPVIQTTGNPAKARWDAGTPFVQP